jgi:hypothetical protein
MEKTVCDSVRVACVWLLTRYGNCCIPYGRRGHVASDGHTAALKLTLSLPSCWRILVFLDVTLSSGVNRAQRSEGGLRGPRRTPSKLLEVLTPLLSVASQKTRSININCRWKLKSRKAIVVCCFFYILFFLYCHKAYVVLNCKSGAKVVLHSPTTFSYLNLSPRFCLRSYIKFSVYWQSCLVWAHLWRIFRVLRVVWKLGANLNQGFLNGYPPIVLLLNLLYRLTPVLPDSRVRGLCGGCPSSVSSVCLDYVLPVDDYLWRSLPDGYPPFFPHGYSIPSF